jgi:uncharacterized metal-binding protein
LCRFHENGSTEHNKGGLSHRRDHRQKKMSESKIPVLSCEGACIRGEIARLAAGIVSKKESYGRGRHGELITVPDSAISRWIKTAERVVLIDGCFLRCQGRIIENIIDKERLIQFDDLSHYNRYTGLFEYEDVPEEERKEAAQSVADWVVDSLQSKPAGKSVSPVQAEGQCGGCCG